MSRILSVPAILLLAVVIASPAKAAEFLYPKVGYSADVKMDMGKGPDGKPMIVKGKVYGTPEGNQRREMASHGRKTIVIRRRDKNVTWILVPEQKTYWESRGGNKKNDPERMIEKGDATITDLGWETINGIRAKQLRIEVVHKDGGRFVGHRWVTSDNVPVRMEGTSNGRQFRIDYTNIKTGKQDPALFTVPTNYRLVGSPGSPGWPPMGVKPEAQIPQMPHGPPPGMTKEQWEQMKKMMEQMQKQRGGGN
jgi:hypothetical protein